MERNLIIYSYEVLGFTLPSVSDAKLNNLMELTEWFPIDAKGLYSQYLEEKLQRQKVKLLNSKRTTSRINRSNDRKAKQERELSEFWNNTDA